MPTRLISAFLSSLLVTLITACASARAPYELRIESPSGGALRTYQHRGELFALGVVGDRYNLRVINHTAGRIEAVVSVDGRDVLSGRPGDFRAERGYVIAPHGEVVIEGFRKSFSEVAAFRFSTPGESYSSRMGSPENVGIIGLAVFTEAPPRPHYADDLATSAGSAEGVRNDTAPAAAAPGAPRGRSAASASPSESRAGERPSRLGTQYGETRESEAHETGFERGRPSHPAHVTTLRYDDRRGLVARGITLDPPAPRSFQGPSAFPLSRFAPPPPERPYCD
jgi:hypothetical protein